MSKARKSKIYQWLSDVRIPATWRNIGARWRVRAVGPRRTAKTKGPTRTKQMDV